VGHMFHIYTSEKGYDIQLSIAKKGEIVKVKSKFNTFLIAIWRNSTYNDVVS